MDAALNSSPLEHVESLIEHLSNTLPQKICTAWQEKSKSQGILISTQALHSAAGESDCESRRSSRAQIEGSVESNKPGRPDESQLPTSAEELQTLISETVAKTCTEWLKNRKEPDGDSGSESEAESEHSHLTNASTHGRILQDSASMARMPEHWVMDSEQPSTFSGDLHPTNYSSLTTSSFMFDSTPFSSTAWINPPLSTPPLYGLPNLMVDDNFDAAAANAYDFSYLPVSPGISFLDPSLQADLDIASHTEPSGTGADVGADGELKNALGPDPLAPLDWAPWTDTNMSPEDLNSTALLPNINPEET